MVVVIEDAIGDDGVLGVVEDERLAADTRLLRTSLPKIKGRTGG